MTGVEEMNLRIRVVTRERLGPGRQKERIVLPPDGQQRGSAFAEEGLEFRVERDIARVVEEEIELDFIVAGTRQQRRVQGVTLRRDQRWIRDAMSILPFRGFRFQKIAQGRAVCG